MKTDNRPTGRKGPLGHRILVWIFSVGVAVLAFWLLGYLLQDIDRAEGPSYQEMVTERIPQELSDQQQAIEKSIEEGRQRTTEVKEQRRVLGESITGSQQTINQLIDLQKLSMQDDAETLSDQEQSALADSLQSFLQLQQQSQTLSSELVSLNLQTQQQQRDRADTLQKITVASRPLMDDYQKASIRHQWRIAGIKLAILCPFLLLIGFLFLRRSSGTYTPIFYAFAASLIVRVLLVMHDHFPDNVFRYLLIITSLLVATWILIKLLRTIARPSKNWLLKQYREAYAAFICPECEFPIRRGPMRFTAWTRRTLRKSVELTSATDASEGDVPYTCPCCETTLFETCKQCSKTRPSLLPACDKCGDVKLIA